MTTAQARETVRANLGVYRAAFVEAPGWPLLDHPQAVATLHTKVGQAYDALRDRKDHLVKMGYKVTGGSLGANVLRLELGVCGCDGSHDAGEACASPRKDVRVIGIDKPRRRQAV